MRSSRIACMAFALLAAQAGAASAAEDLGVSVERKGAWFAVRAHATVAAPVALVWEVLTDYENIPQFIPGIARSAVLRRAQDRALIEHAARPGVQIDYTGEIEPDFDLPPLIGPFALRSMVREQFTAMIDEIERRALGGEGQ